MFKKFWDFQKLLNISISATNDKNTPKLSYMITIMVGTFLTISLASEGGIFLYALLLILEFGNLIINSKNRFFESVPVSKKYICINIYIHLILMAEFFVIAATIGILSINIIDANPIDNYINSVLVNWKGLLFFVCIIIMTVNILIPVFFIKINILRKTLTIAIGTLIAIVIITFRNTLPIVPSTGEINLIKSFKFMGNCNEVLLVIMGICLILIPISVLVSYKIYRGKEYIL